MLLSNYERIPLINYDSYFSDMAFFLLEEGYVWETYELINEFEQKEEI